MLGQSLIAFREVLEAALITAIIVAYLSRTGRGHLSRYVWYGVYSSVAASLVLGASIWLAYGALSKSTQLLFEAVAAYTAVFVLSWMILWMATKGKKIKEEVEERVRAIVTRGSILGLVSFSFIVVFREGLETVLFLTPWLVADPLVTMIGVVVGTLSALALVYAIFVLGKRLDIRRFFYFTSILLVLLAGGLAGYGTHELIEYNELEGSDLGWLDDPVYDLGIPKDNPLHHKGIVGSVFAVMFGYTVKAEWARVIVHLTYLAIVLPLVISVYSPEKFNGFVNRVFLFWRPKRKVG